MNISIFGLCIEADEHVANNRFASREFGESNNRTLTYSCLYTYKVVFLEKVFNL